MSERSRSLFFTTSLCTPQKLERHTPASKVETTTPAPEEIAYEVLVSALTSDEKAQLDRITPFIQKLISQIQEKYKSPEFAGIIVERDTIHFDFPEKLSPAVLSICSREISKHYQRALDAHNANIPKPQRTRDDLHRLN